MTPVDGRADDERPGADVTELVQRADDLLAAGQPAEAVALFQRITSDHPDDAWLWHRLAAALLALEGGVESDTVARDAAERAVTLEPTSAVGYRLLSEAALRLGDPEAALATMRSAVHAAPDSWVAHLDLAAALAERSDRHREAWREARRAARLAPADRPEPHLLLGDLALRDGDLNHAAAAFTDAREREPGNEYAVQGLARVFERMGGTGFRIAGVPETPPEPPAEPADPDAPEPLPRRKPAIRRDLDRRDLDRGASDPADPDGRDFDRRELDRGTGTGPDAGVGEVDPAEPRTDELPVVPAEEPVPAGAVGVPDAARALGNYLAGLAAVTGLAAGMLLLMVPGHRAGWFTATTLLAAGGLALVAAGVCVAGRRVLGRLGGRPGYLIGLIATTLLVLAAAVVLLVSGLAGRPGGLLRIALGLALAGHAVGHLVARFADRAGRYDPEDYGVTGAPVPGPSLRTPEAVRSRGYLGLALGGLLHAVVFGGLGLAAGALRPGVFQVLVVPVVGILAFLDAVQLAAVCGSAWNHRLRFGYRPIALMVAVAAGYLAGLVGLAGALSALFRPAPAPLLFGAAGAAGAIAVLCALAAASLRR